MDINIVHYRRAHEQLLWLQQILVQKWCDKFTNVYNQPKQDLTDRYLCIYVLQTVNNQSMFIM